VSRYTLHLVQDTAELLNREIDHLLVRLASVTVERDKYKRALQAIRNKPASNAGAREAKRLADEALTVDWFKRK
jgi:hypothetical protein